MNYWRWIIIVFLTFIVLFLAADDPSCLDCSLGQVRNAQVVIDPFTMFGTAETTLSLSVSSNADDGYDLDGGWNGGTDVINVGHFSSFGVFDGGCRFTGVNILAGATIVSATFTIEVVVVIGDGADAIIQGRDVNNAAAWNGTGPATMAVTTANVTRTLGTVQSESFDVREIIQEIVDNNSGTGNALSIGVLNNSTPDGNTCQYEALEDSGTNEATLDITYTT